MVRPARTLASARSMTASNRRRCSLRIFQGRSFVCRGRRRGSARRRRYWENRLSETWRPYFSRYCWTIHRYGRRSAIHWSTSRWLTILLAGTGGLRECGGDVQLEGDPVLAFPAGLPDRRELRAVDAGGDQPVGDLRVVGEVVEGVVGVVVEVGEP